MEQLSTWIIDSLEGDRARLEGPSGIAEIPRVWVPRHSREGDVLAIAACEEGDVTVLRVTTDPDARAEREERISEIRRRIRRQEGGDLDL